MRLDEFIAGVIQDSEVERQLEAEAAADDEVLSEATLPGTLDGISVAQAYVEDYLRCKRAIAALEIEAGTARAAVIETLATSFRQPGWTCVYEGVGTVSVVKGRVSEKLDRSRLARSGVSAEVLDGATTKTEGDPSVRIAPWTDSATDHLAARGWKREERP